MTRRTFNREFKIDHNQSHNSRVGGGMAAAWATMLLLGLRSSSMSSIKPEQTRVSIDRDGVQSVTFVINHVKRGDAEQRPFQRIVYGDKSPDHPRSILVATIAAFHDKWTTEFWGPDAATTVTESMRTGLDQSCLPPHAWVGSHSWRKAGASILASMNVSLLTVKAWGMWASTSSAECYVDPHYANSRITRPPKTLLKLELSIDL